MPTATVCLPPVDTTIDRSANNVTVILMIAISIPEKIDAILEDTFHSSRQVQLYAVHMLDLMNGLVGEKWIRGCCKLTSMSDDARCTFKPHTGQKTGQNRIFSYKKQG